MRLGIDIDDVLFPWCETIHAAAERAGITNGNKITQWHIHEDYGVPESEVIRVINTAYALGVLYNEPPIEGSVGALHRLQAAGHSIHLVTARGFEGNGQRVRMDTSDWIDRFKIPHDSLTFTRDKTILDLDVLVDDKPDHVQNSLALGRMAYLVTAPHNGDAHHLNGVRVSSMAQAADTIINRFASERSAS